MHPNDARREAHKHLDNADRLLDILAGCIKGSGLNVVKAIAYDVRMAADRLGFDIPMTREKDRHASE